MGSLDAIDFLKLILSVRMGTNDLSCTMTLL